MAWVAKKADVIARVQNHPTFSKKLSDLVDKAKNFLVNYDTIRTKYELREISFLYHVLRLGYQQIMLEQMRIGTTVADEIKPGVILFDKKNQSLIEEIENLLFDMFKIDLNWLSSV